VDAPSRCVKVPARAALSPCQGGLLAWPLAQDKENRRLGLARRLSWPACGGAVPLERTSLATSLALTRGARSRDRHMSRRSGSQTRSLSSEGSSLHGLTGRPVLGPISLLGLALL